MVSLMLIEYIIETKKMSIRTFKNKTYLNTGSQQRYINKKHSNVEKENLLQVMKRIEHRIMKSTRRKFQCM